MKKETKSAPPNLSAISGKPTYFGYDDLVDYILGITFEIWEQRQVERILDYYDENIDVFSLEGLTRGNTAMVDQTHATLSAYPDRLLLADDVICSGSLDRGFSSHRIISPMTNEGPTVFGAATGRKLVVMNIADCEIRAGRITREWLFRDNRAIVEQLGFNAREAARALCERMDTRLIDRLEEEFERTFVGPAGSTRTIGASEPDRFTVLAQDVLSANWTSDTDRPDPDIYAPYAVLHRSPVRLHSGRDAIHEHYRKWRAVLPDARLQVDHVCSQTSGHNGHDIAVRWSVAGHQGGMLGDIGPAGHPVYIVGATHWRELNGRIVSEWTVFDEVAVMAQLLQREN
ncbi:MAG: ester cyclase [Planctomycetes bacterium]|nr:ester cyclase [Planctomycetota bacterium]